MISRPLRRTVQVGIVGALAAGVAGFTAYDKSVALSVDGDTSTVHAFGGTVQDVLDSQGIAVGAHDVVVPSPSSSISDGDKIVVRYGRKLTATVNGTPKEYWTTATTVGAALRELGIRGSQNAYLSASRSQTLGRDGLDVTVRTPKTVKLDITGKPKTTTTTERTVAEVLKDLKVKTDGNDVITPGPKKVVTDGMKLKVVKVDTKTVSRTERIPYGTVRHEDSSMYVGRAKLVSSGHAGTRKVTYRVVLHDGTAVSRTATGTSVVSKPAGRVINVGTKPRPAPKPAPAPAPSPSSSSSSSSSPAPSSPAPSSPAPSSSGAGVNLANAAMWDRIAQCESTGNWGINTGNGYYGGLQFDLQTWLGAGGGDFASRPDLASRAGQITVANRVYASRGLSPWGCAHAA